MIKSTFLKSWLLLLCLIVGSSAAWADETYSLTPDQTSTGSSATSYITTLTGFTHDGVSWMMNQWNPKTLQVKTNQGSATNEFRFYNTSAFSGRITKVVISFKALTVSDASKLMFLGGTSAVTAYTGGTAGTWDATKKTLTWTPTAAENFTYFAFYQNGKAASGTNSLAETDAIVVTYESGSSQTLKTSDLALTGAPVVLNFDLYNNSSAQTVSFTSSSTGAVTVSDNEYVSTSVSGSTITVTPLKKTPSAQTITVNQAADDTYAAGSVTFTVNIDDSTPQTGEWVKTDLADLTANDVFVILGNTTTNELTTFYHALTNDKGTSSSPSAPNVSVSDDKISGTVADNLKWNIGGNATDGYVFYPNGTTEEWLYCTDSNSGVRIGTNENKLFVVEAGYLKNVATSRYLGFYKATSGYDWRCYTNYTGNIANQVFSFYKYVDGTAASTPRISADNVNIAYDATSGSIEFTVTNPANDGVLTATTTDSWLTLGTVGPTIPFTTTANDASAERTATVTLTYTYNTNETVTKTVTITQAAAPMIYKTIPALFADATSTATDVTISFGGWVVSAVKGNNAYLTDNQGNGLIIFASGHGFQVNDVLTGTASCKLQLYRGSAELTELTSATTGLTVTAGGTVTAQTIAINTLSGVNTGALLSFTGLTYNGTALVDGDNNAITPYTTLYSGTFENGKEYNVKGIYLQYNNTKELLPRSADDIEEVVSTTPSITVASTQVNVEATGGNGTIDVTYENIATIAAAIQFYSATGAPMDVTDYDWITATINADNDIAYTVVANGGDARTAYLKVYALDNDANDVYSELITITQAKYVAPPADFATLPFSFDGGRADIEDIDGLTQEGLDTDYSSSPKLKFNGTGDYVLLHFNERPGKLTFDIKGNSFSGGTFKVQTSEDGTTYSDLETYTDLSTTQNEEFNNLGENVRFIRWIYTAKDAGNVALGNIKLEKPSTTPSIVVANTTVNIDAAAANGTIGVTYKNITTIVAEVKFYESDGTTEANYSWIAADINNENNVEYVIDANDGDARTAYLKIHALDNDAKDVYSDLITVSQAKYVIDYATLPFDWAGGTSADFLALNGVTASGLGGDYAASNAPYLIKLDGTGDYIQVKTDGQIQNVTAEVKMLGGSNKSSITVQSSADGTTFTDVEVLSISGSQNDVLALETTKAFGANDRYVRLLFTKGSNVGVGAITINCVRKSISEAGYATYCSPYALDFSGFGEKELKAYEATINGNEVTFSEGDKLFAAGEGMLLKGAAEGTYTIPVIATATKNENNKLIGVLEETEITETGIFVLLNGGNGVGFYKTKSAFTVGAHTAYLPAQAGGNGAREFIAIDDNTTTGVNSIDNGQLTIDNVYNLNGQRVNNAKKGLYIVNGKKVVIK